MNYSYLFLADGFEEIEALSVIDIMRRAGLQVSTVSINDTPVVTGAHGIPVAADCIWTEVLNFNNADWLICPGGMPGSTNLAQFAPLCELLKAHAADGGNIAAICAAPAVVLAPLGILQGKEATRYPGFEAQARQHGAKMHDAPVIVDGNIVTANGPASAMRFALTIVQQACGTEKSQEIGSGLLYYPKQMNFYF
ncbi:MAG: DJ-1/PfpI family protein [Bacteroidales bacterium]|nr:DJ-1/PfpI family protein [Bacteroidales bacterium]